MNLKVDLILPDEIRSTSVLGVKSLVRIAIIVVPIILIVWIGLTVSSFMKLNSTLDRLRKETEGAKPKQKEAGELAGRRDQNKRVLAEIQTWSHARLEWHKLLLSLQQEVPPTIQLTQFAVTQTIQPGPSRLPARSYQFTIRGKALGRDADSAIENFKARLEKGSVLADLVTKISLKGDRDPDPNAEPSDRIFTISCTLKGVEFK